ncbi:Hypothetical predicted protein [Pelobates cultripes]|uniref:Uncharacterized protein n=1 Tax=Pelobates cultripes TaxID=61616 RepID=A0AAD1RPS7_PELCU|nr:Hypothetical predicted protein [Pelobates cultripes]
MRRSNLPTTAPAEKPGEQRSDMKRDNMAATTCTWPARKAELEAKLEELFAKFWTKLESREQQAGTNIPAQQLTLTRTDPAPPRAPATHKVSHSQQTRGAYGPKRQQLPTAVANHKTHTANSTQRPKHPQTTLRRQHTTTDRKGRRLKLPARAAPKPICRIGAEARAFPGTLLCKSWAIRPTHLAARGDHAVTRPMYTSSELGVHLEVTLPRHPYTRGDSRAPADPWAHDPVDGVNGHVARAPAKASGQRHMAPGRRAPRNYGGRATMRGAGRLAGPVRRNDKVTTMGQETVYLPKHTSGIG